MHKLILAAALAALMGAVMQSVGAAQAPDFSQEITAREVFNQLKDTPSIRQSTEMWISGLLYGIRHANAALGSRPLFCQGEPIRFEQEISMTERFVEMYPNTASWPFGAVMLSALQQALPCAGGVQ
jgi:hypothetical protein